MKYLNLIILIALIFMGCRVKENGTSINQDFSDKAVIKLVATTNIVADLLKNIGGERVEIEALMGAGVDPHLYKARESDVTRMGDADIIFYNGLHLEGKMGEVLENMNHLGIKTIAVTDGMPREDLTTPPAFEGNYDPHVWMDVALWAKSAKYVGQQLALVDSAHAEGYKLRTEAYLAGLVALDAIVRAKIEEIPMEQRVLITAHDAFGYYGMAYNITVKGLQGISTATEAGTADVQGLAKYVTEHKIPAIFIESSVSPRNIEAVQAAVKSRGFDVKIGGSLYSDALGNPDTPAGTYKGMIEANTNTIVNALLGIETTSEE